MERVIKVRVPTKLQMRFGLALQANKVDEEETLNKWISDYVEKHEENIAAKKLIEEANRLNKKRRLLIN